MTPQRLDYDFKPLDLPPGVDWVPMWLASNLLGIHPSQVRRDRAVLEFLDLIRHVPRSKGFQREAMEALWIFRQLVTQRGRSEAISQISEILENYRERKRQRSSS